MLYLSADFVPAFLPLGIYSMSVCEVNDPTLSYVLCLNPLLFLLALGFASPERDEAAISEAHCDGGMHVLGAGAATNKCF